MKIQQLFEELEKITKNKEKEFADSGMANCYNKMQYGFFPLGLGILTENNKTNEVTPTDEIEEGGVMVLGNDFGTATYVENVKKYSEGIGETKSTTIQNLKKRICLNTNKTFFTNFYLGVRTNKDAKMMHRVEELTKDYKTLCYKFFIKQLDLIKPQLVICLGHDVKDALIDSIVSELFDKWKPKSITLKKLYDSNEDNYEIDIESKELGVRKFVVIPHPCYIGNLKKEYMVKLNAILNSK